MKRGEMQITFHSKKIGWKSDMCVSFVFLIRKIIESKKFKMI